MFDAGLRRCAGAAVKPGDEYHIAVALGHARCDYAYIDFCDELDVNSGIVIGIFEVVE